ncbi:myb-binding protein 1A-like protein isoform X2 [Carcharodon carcharias]|uniref:myb-binding protein 1A-like protein isoform X2 n=1 Tax=Carcharodon carcharias TaxID=13397 RepID=UPI001B7F35EA|nr:myb-binding protein 1A-like protein isoform X2 [Carcharodon carcharias]
MAVASEAEWIPSPEAERSPESIPGTGGTTVPRKKRNRGPGSNIGLLQQNRQFLDFFWDIAKAAQDVRLQGIKGLLAYLKRPESRDDELQYAIKRLIDGLAATRETARPGFSLALAQQLIRNAAFGNLFGVLALSQSGRLIKEPNILLQSIQLLQSLSHFKQHLSNLPRKTIVDILSETPEAVFKEILFEALKADMSSAFSNPELLHLLLVALERFPNVLKPKTLKTLLGSTTIMTSENIPKLLEMLKLSAKAVKKDQTLPPLALSLVHIVLKEGTFETFWKELVENGLLKHQTGPSCFLCFRLLGATLPLLTLPQLNLVLTGEVMQHYGNHVLSAQLPDRFKFAPEMETYVDSFLENIQDAEKQFTVITKFTCLTNRGNPVIPSYWKVVHHLQPSVLLNFVSWLKSMFINPNLGTCIDFSTKRQKESKEQADLAQYSVLRLRTWIVARLSSIVDNNQVKKEEDLVMDIARFVFFHAFFATEHQTPDIPETEATLSIPLDQTTRNIIANSFFGLLNHLNSLPPLGDSRESVGRTEKRTLGFTADGNLWISRVVHYANALLLEKKSVRVVKPFMQGQREAWNRMLQSVEDLQKKSKKSQQLETSAFQLLFLLVGIHLFKNGEDSVALLNDIHECLQKALLKKRKKHSKPVTDEEQPEWVEVMVEILLSLLSQPSRLMRQITKTVFVRICPHVTKAALQLILDVFKPESEGGGESAVIVTEELDEMKKVKLPSRYEMEGESDSDESEEEGDDADDEDDDEDDSGNEEVEEEEAVDDNFRMELMKVLQAGRAVSKEGESSDEEEVDDETMMALDKNISSLFAEHRKRLQAKKDQATKLRKEKTLRTDFKMKVLDLIEVFLVKQPESPLVFDIIEPLIAIIEETPSSHSDQQEQDFLRKTADIFKNQLCKAKHYCRDISEVKEDLHELMERLLNQACQQPDSSVSLYCFSGALYLFRVLKGNPTEPAAADTSEEEAVQEQSSQTQTRQVDSIGSLDIVRVTEIYKKALSLFMTKRNCSLTGPMFIDLFNRFPVMCGQLLQPAIKYITDGVRQHQQGQACSLVLKALQTREVRETLIDTEGKALIEQVINQIKQCLRTVTKIKLKVDQEKVVKCLELISGLIKIVDQQKLNVSVKQLVPALQKLGQLEEFGKTSQVDHTYWHVMKRFGIMRPKKEKVKARVQNPVAAQGVLKKKKGFLPETKKRKNWKKTKGPVQEDVQEGKENSMGKPEDVPKAEEVGQEKKRNKRKRKKKKKNPERGATGNPGAKSGPPAKKIKTNAVEMGQGDKVGKRVTVKKEKQGGGAAE